MPSRRSAAPSCEAGSMPAPVWSPCANADSAPHSGEETRTSIAESTTFALLPPDLVGGAELAVAWDVGTLALVELELLCDVPRTSHLRARTRGQPEPQAQRVRSRCVVAVELRHNAPQLVLLGAEAFGLARARVCHGARQRVLAPDPTEQQHVQPLRKARQREEGA
eukprot:1833055-Pleurochrysis_carterae.AAC.1